MIPLRDYLAAAALPAIIEEDALYASEQLFKDGERFAGEGGEIAERHLPRDKPAGYSDAWMSVAEAAYALADAMLEARKKSY